MNAPTFWALVWAAILLPAMVLEVWALIHHRPGTLSWTVWAGMRSPWFRVPFFAGWIWATYHFIVEFLWLTAGIPLWWDDVLVVVAGALLGAAAKPVPAETDGP